MRRTSSVALACLAAVQVGLPTPSIEPAGSGTVPLADPFEYTRLFADTDGDSHFEDAVLEFTLVDYAPPAPPISLTAAFGASSLALISSPSGWRGDWHPAPRRQIVVVLVGELQVEVSDGEVRTFGPGSVVLVEDTFGTGHVSRIVSRERCTCAVVPLADEGERVADQEPGRTQARGSRERQIDASWSAARHSNTQEW